MAIRLGSMHMLDYLLINVNRAWNNFSKLKM